MIISMCIYCLQLCIFPCGDGEYDSSWIFNLRFIPVLTYYIYHQVCFEKACTVSQVLWEHARPAVFWCDHNLRHISSPPTGQETLLCFLWFLFSYSGFTSATTQSRLARGKGGTWKTWRQRAPVRVPAQWARRHSWLNEWSEPRSLMIWFNVEQMVTWSSV